MDKNVIHIIGGGLVGTLAAIFLARRGFDVALYERRGDMRKEKVEAGRSINLVVTPRGFAALEKVGLKEKVQAIAIPLKARMLHDVEGNETRVPYGHKDNETIDAVSRGLLNQLLLEAADSYDNVNIHFRRKCLSYASDSKALVFLNEETGKEEKVVADVTIGADGAFSTIRKSMLDQVRNFNYAQDFLAHGYKELVIPPGENGQHRMASGFFHIWPRGNYSLIGIPNLDGSFTCTLFFPYKGDVSFEKLDTAQDILDFFNAAFPDAVPLMPSLTEDFLNNPVGAFVTIKCGPWNIGGQAVLLGDAAHAIVPFYGQGMNCGFEDCRVLDEILDTGERDWEVVFSKLYELRRPNTDAIADMAADHFTELSNTTADPKFQLKRQVELEMENRFPDRFIPRYSMVAFHPEIPYAEARRLGEAQDKMLDELCANINAPEDVDWEQAGRLLHKMG